MYSNHFFVSFSKKKKKSLLCLTVCCGHIAGNCICTLAVGTQVTRYSYYYHFSLISYKLIDPMILIWFYFIIIISAHHMFSSKAQTIIIYILDTADECKNNLAISTGVLFCFVFCDYWLPYINMVHLEKEI